MGLSRNEVKALEMVGLKGFEERAPRHLSGGQKKLVAIIVGTVAILIISFGFGKILKKKA
jgi:energy-coupling factor transporter ATP-binding protein EcfA2